LDLAPIHRNGRKRSNSAVPKLETQPFALKEVDSEDSEDGFATSDEVIVNLPPLRQEYSGWRAAQQQQGQNLPASLQAVQRLPLLGSIVWAVCTIQQETASRARTNISITRRARFPALRDLFVIGATRSMINNRLGGKDGDGWKRERNAGVLLVHTNFFDCFTEHFMRVAKCCMHRFLLLGWPFFH